MNYTLRQLAYFVAAAELGTTTAAAAHFYMTQSAMSAALTHLEKSLRTQLFVRRRGRGLELTSTGIALLPMARRLLHSAEDLGSAADSLQNAMSGSLIVGCFDAVSPAVMTPLMAVFGRRHPGLSFGVLSEAQDVVQAAVLDGRVELAVLYDIDLDGELSADELFVSTAHVLVAASHPLAAGNEVSLSDLQDEDLILLSSSPARDSALRGMAALGFTPRVRYELQNFDLIRSMVHRGLGYTLITQPRGVTPQHWGPEIATVPIADAMPRIRAVLVRPQGSRPTRRAEAFRQFCLTEGRVLVGGP